MAWPVAERVSRLESGTMCDSFATTFSMPMTAICTSGTVVDRRPLPSFSTSHSVPVSAAAKLTPDRPMSASTNAWQRAAAGLDQRVDVFRVRVPGCAARTARDVGLGLVDRRHHDVRRLLAGQLDDVLAHVRFDAVDAALGEVMVQLDLLAGHRLALDHAPRRGAGRCRG
jgi:hypothetical protein